MGKVGVTSFYCQAYSVGAVIFVNLPNIHRTHPNERILEVDAPLSYGMADVKQEPATLNSVSFLWDPTRDTGVFVKVHCISTEFTPKKHGGERGVPFRLQVNSLSVSHLVKHLVKHPVKYLIFIRCASNS